MRDESGCNLSRATLFCSGALIDDVRAVAIGNGRRRRSA